ncbi:MAG TPA: HAMP domain-containing sensor histidine kinase, partial [Chryseosolibacter sp.]|nr:HAMP domain-containing sensor histidine kinase [Chryseosolibacter sp.]
TCAQDVFHRGVRYNMNILFVDLLFPEAVNELVDTHPLAVQTNAADHMTDVVTKSSLASTERLVQTVQELSLAQNLEEVMRIVRTVARELTGADGSTFVLRDNDQCYYADEDAISPLWKGSRFPIKACISGWVMLNKQAVFIEDIYADDRIPSDAYRPTFVKSLAMVPIRTMDPLGALGNYWADYRKPTEEEVTLLQSLADITAVTIENIKVRNMLEEKVKERTLELAAALDREKKLNELKSSFVSTASHEFRTPLSTILSSTNLLESYIENNEPAQLEKHFKRIKSSVSNLKDLLNDFLSLEKIEQGKVEIHAEFFDLTEFLQNIIEDIGGVRKNGQLIHYAHKGSTFVLLDKKLLKNIMFNLLSNAIKYSEKDIEMTSEVLDGDIVINVKDRGIGIPEAQKPKLFDKFFRASNAAPYQGTGLGLSIVKHYATLLNGRIDFSSKEGEGTTFTVNLPNP